MSSSPPPWGFVPKGVQQLNKFEKQERRLHPDIKACVELAIDDLVSEEIPDSRRPRPSIGNKSKDGEQIWLIDLHGTHFRISFHFEGEILILRRVAPHDKVVDKDP